ncbi:MAG: hypothetical protein ACE5KO_02405 [Candidatus Bathyarchaeia archaeon]
MTQKQEALIQIGQTCKAPPRNRSLYGLVALPWCCVVPVAISWIGAGSAFVAALFAPFTLPLLGTSVLLLGYSHYRTWIRGNRSRPQLFWLGFATALSVGFWSWSILVMRAIF